MRKELCGDFFWGEIFLIRTFFGWRGGGGGGVERKREPRVLIFTSNNRIRDFFLMGYFGVGFVKDHSAFLVRAQPNTTLCGSNYVTSFAYPCH